MISEVFEYFEIPYEKYDNVTNKIQLFDYLGNINLIYESMWRL